MGWGALCIPGQRPPPEPPGPAVSPGAGAGLRKLNPARVVSADGTWSACSSHGTWVTRCTSELRLADSTSTTADLVWQCHLPPFLTLAWQHARFPLEPTDKLNHQLELVHVVLRYSVALLWAELRGLERSLPVKAQELFRKLERPTYGSWLEAADALARSLAQVPRTSLVLPELVDQFARSSEGASSRGPLIEPLTELIDIRNEKAHARGGDAGVAASVELLGRARAPLVTVCRSLRCLRDRPLCFVQSTRQSASGVRSVIVRAGGQSFTNSAFDQRVNLPEKVPFIVSESGTVLLLHPFVIARELRGAPVSVRLLERVEKGRGVYPPSGAGSVEVADEVRLEELSSRATRQEDVLPPSVAERLVQPGSRRDGPKIDGYRVLGLLGSGGSGRVFLAQRAPSDGQEPIRAIKVLHRDAIESDVMRARFKREYEVMRRLDHPNIARVIEHGEDAEGGLYTVLEHVAGGSLERAPSVATMGPRRAVAICCEVLRAVRSTHEKGIVHRDIKPSNIMLDTSGNVKVIDFGIARDLAGDPLTRTIDGLGSTGYAAPEQLDGRPVDHRADLFAVGRLLQYLLECGESDLGKELQPSLVRVIRRATREDPAERYESAARMLADLEQASLARDDAPVGKGDKLEPNYLITREPSSVGDGYWCARAAVTTTGEVVTLILGAPSAKHRAELVERYRSASRETLRTLGARDPSVTRDGIPFIALGTDEGAKAVELFLRGPAGGSPAGSALSTEAKVALGVLAGALATGAAALLNYRRTRGGEEVDARGDDELPDEPILPSRRRPRGKKP